MSKKVFNMQGGKHSAAAYTELEKFAYGSVVASLASFVCSAGTGMNVNISTGAGLISDTIARRIGTDAVETATVPTASASFNRIDTVVAYIDTAVSPTTSVTDNTNNILKFVVVAGTASASPAAPTGSAILAAIGAGKPYMVLYDILVPQNATNTASMTFTDRRSFMQAIALADAIVTTAKLANLAVTTGKIADNAVTLAKLAANIWGYEILGRVDASGNPTSMDTGTFTPKKFMKIIFIQHSGGVTLTSGLRLNSDSGNNYNFHTNENGTESSGSGANWLQTGSNTLEGMHVEFSLVSEAAYRKALVGFEQFWDSSGGLYRNSYAGYWNNAVNQVSRVSAHATVGSFKNGSAIIVLGKD